MAGIYLHIPFCKQACYYCNFHFSTSLRHRSDMVAALVKELNWRKEYLPNKKIDSIYLGGGTPSLLNEIELKQLFDCMSQHWEWSEEIEITLEANPDDLSIEKLKMLSNTPVNRLSIGIQSFAEEDLRFMNRAHNAEEARTCIEKALKQGFNNLTIDLIYGSPTTSDAQWRENLQIIIDYGIPHLSSYALTVEDKTALAHQIAKGKVAPLAEEQAERQFNILLEMTEAAGLEQYEISNFAKDGAYARHNTSYWRGQAYLGVGPSAHSFNGQNQRRWNIANNAKYLTALTQIEAHESESNGQDDLYEIEELSLADQYNEYIMTGLRTKWGIDLDRIAAFGPSVLQHFKKEFQQFDGKNLFAKQQKVLKLSNTAKFLADGIASDLFIID